MRSLAPMLALLCATPALATPALATPDPCTFEPFTLNNGIPMPGMRDGRLDFESAEVCATLPHGLKGAVSRDGFLDLRVRGTPVNDAVPLGGGLLAPSTRMGCRSIIDYTYILFEDGELLLTSAGGQMTPAIAAHLLVNVWPNWMKVPKIPRECRARYTDALLHAVFASPESFDEVDLINIAATEPDVCQRDDFRAPLQGMAARWALTWGRTPFIWARLGECLLSGLVFRPDEHVLSLSCPGHSGQIIVVVPPTLLAPFVGANSGMTADATIHPMDATCLGAWELWETRPLEPVTPYLADDE